MMCGLQSAGKTTSVAKLAGQFKNKGRKCLLTACDIYRPAAWNAFGSDKEGQDFRACAAYGPLYK